MTEYNTPESLPSIAAGPQAKGSGKACVMQYVSLLAGEEWTDFPACTLPVLALAAQTVNDTIVADAERTALLVPLIGRLFGTAGTGKFNLHQVQARLAEYAMNRLTRLHAVSGAVRDDALRMARRAVNQAVEVPTTPPDVLEEHRAEWKRLYAADTAGAQEAVRVLMHEAHLVGGPGLAVAELSQLIDEYDLITDRHKPTAMSRDELAALAGMNRR